MSNIQQIVHLIKNRILHKQTNGIKEQDNTLLLQFLKFGLVGLSNTILAYLINVIVLLALESWNVAWDYICGNLVSFFLSVAWSFYWNSLFVFKLNRKKKSVVFKALIKTYISYALTGIVLNNLFSWIWIERIGISKYIAPIINLFFSVPLNFVINKFWAFRSNDMI